MTSAAHQLQPVCSPTPPVGFEHRPDGGVPSHLRSATLNHAQMYDGRRVGQPALGRDRHAPVRVSFVRGRGLLRLGRRLSAGGLFAADGRGANPCVAIDFQSLRESSFQRVSEANPAHFSVSVRYVHKRSGGLVVNVQFPVGEIRNV